jgi:hypothetical protein
MSAIAPPSGAADDYPRLRERALIGVMTCVFAGINTVVACRWRRAADNGTCYLARDLF